MPILVLMPRYRCRDFQTAISEEFFPLLILCEIILSSKTVLINWLCDYYQSIDLISKFDRNFLKISESLSHSGTKPGPKRFVTFFQNLITEKKCYTKRPEGHSWDIIMVCHSKCIFLTPFKNVFVHFLIALTNWQISFFWLFITSWWLYSISFWN